MKKIDLQERAIALWLGRILMTMSPFLLALNVWTANSPYQILLAPVIPACCLYMGLRSIRAGSRPSST